MAVTIWHHPRCSKSRQTLALLTDRGISPTIRLYQNDAPSTAEIEATLTALGIEAKALVRRKDARDLGLGDLTAHADLVQAMHDHPKIIERPIVFSGEKAAIGRPPEAVLAILD